MLEDAWDNAPEDGDTLREELRKNERAVGELISAGSIQSVSKNSTSQSYAFSGGGQLTTAEVARGWRDLLNLFDRCSNILLANSVSASDENVHAEMVWRLQPVYVTRPDISNLRREAFA